MSTQNNAAQAAAQILTYLGFAQAVSMEPAADPRRDHIQALIESALLSKLRAPVTGDAQADDLNKKLFEAAILDLAAISEHLGLDPDEGGAEPIIGAIDELRRERDSWVNAQRAADDEAAPQASPAADGRDAKDVERRTVRAFRARLEGALVGLPKTFFTPFNVRTAIKDVADSFSATDAIAAQQGEGGGA